MWRALFIGVLAISAALGIQSAAAAEPTPSPGDTSGRVLLSGAGWGPDQLINKASRKCLDHSDWGAGLYAYVYGCGSIDPRSNQFWYFECANSECNIYRLKNAKSGKCLDHSDWGKGLYAYVYTCNGAANQNWYLYSYPAINAISLVNKASGKCLDHSSGGTGLHAYVYTCNHSTQQLWEDWPILT